VENSRGDVKLCPVCGGSGTTTSPTAPPPIWWTTVTSGDYQYTKPSTGVMIQKEVEAMTCNTNAELWDTFHHTPNAFSYAAAKQLLIERGEMS
jgi:hypothetical protein